MARYKYTVYVHNYQFNPPAQITETEYKYFKELIRANPNAKLNAKLQENPLKKGLKILSKVAIAPLYLFAPGQIEGDIKSAMNKARAQSEEDDFYLKLKNLVIKTNNFAEFAALVKQQFPNYR